MKEEAYINMMQCTRTKYLEDQCSGNGECGGRAPSCRGGMCGCLRCAHSSPPNDEPIPFCDPGFHRVQHVVEWLALARRPRWLTRYSDHCDWTVVAVFDGGDCLGSGRDPGSGPKKGGREKQGEHEREQTNISTSGQPTRVHA